MYPEKGKSAPDINSVNETNARLLNCLFTVAVSFIIAPFILEMRSHAPYMHA